MTFDPSVLRSIHLGRHLFWTDLKLVFLQELESIIYSSYSTWTEYILLGIILRNNAVDMNPLTIQSS